MLAGNAAAWRRALAVSEDILTSTVFERLGYLPGDLPIRLLLRAADPVQLRFIPTPEPVIRSEAWPNVSDDGMTEPDWLFETDSYRFLIEAKWGAGVVPSVAQLTEQFDDFGRTRGRKGLIQVAVVQSGTVPLPPGQPLVVVTWGRLRDEVLRESRREHGFGVHRTLSDIRDALDRRGLASVFLDTLPGLAIAGSFEPIALGAAPAPSLPPLPGFTISPDAEFEPWI